MVMVSTAISVACGVILVTWVWKLLNWAWLTPRKLEKWLREQGLNGNSYRPLYGDLKDTSKMRAEAREKPIPFGTDYCSRVIPFQVQHMDKYGKNSFSWSGPVPVINIAKPEEIRDALTRMNEFKSPKLNPLILLLTPGLARLEGPKWAMHRKLINPAFHLEKLKLMIPAVCASATEMINKWETMISGSSSSEVDVWPHLVTLSADVISRSAFGSSYAEGQRIFQLLKEQTEWAIRLFQSVYIPGWKYVPTKNNRKMKELDSNIQKLLKGIVDKRKKAMEAGEVVNNDLLGMLMESNTKETQSIGKNKQHGMSFQDIIDECKLFYFAGQETTSVLLVWAMILLAKHQDWQARAREEVLAAFGNNQPPEFEGLNHLKIVTMILYEVLRLYPPVVSVSRRVYDHPTKLGNLCVPPGAMVILPILLVHQDPTLWGDDAKEFNPSRFSEGIAKATRGNISFFPFGWGPRICIGQNFALVEAKMALCMILQRFSFELSPSYVHAPTTVITLQPQFGAPIVLHGL